MVDQHTLQILEYPKIISHIAGKCRIAAGSTFATDDARVLGGERTIGGTTAGIPSSWNVARIP